MRIIRVVVLALAGLALLTGCALFSGQQQAAPPPPAEAVETLPTITPTLEPTSIPGEMPVLPTPSPTLAPLGTAGPGEILFVRMGQVWAIGPDGSGERPITEFPSEPGIHDLAVSPDGRYLAFSVNSQQVVVTDLTQGQQAIVDEVTDGGVGSFVWSPTGDALYYQKLVIDPEAAGPSGHVWKAAMPPGDVPVLQPVIEADPGTAASLTPIAALGDGRLVVRELTETGEGASRVFFIYDPATGERVPLAEDYSLWDVSPDHSKALLFDLAEVTPGRQVEPLGLFMGELSPSEGLVNVLAVLPTEGTGVYQAARFMPDSLGVIALYSDPTGPEFSLGYQTRVVLLRPDEGGVYRATPLDIAEQTSDLAFCWHGDLGVVVQRWLVETDTSEIWLLPPDGSPGIRLTTGEQPVVVGGQ
jgi:dipeptidyl aminopeptidase/acylaminoacyl peptidase